MQKTNIISFSKKIESMQHVTINYGKDNISLIGSKGCINIYFNLPLRVKKKFFTIISYKKEIQSTQNITLEDFKTIFIDHLSQIEPYTFFDNYSNKVYNEIKRYISDSENFQLYKMIGNLRDPNSCITITGSYIYKIV